MSVLIALMVAMATGIVAQQPSGSSYTFMHAEKSWLQFKPSWPTGVQHLRFDLSFRTKRANVFIFYMTFPKDDASVVDLTMWGSLKKGELHVTLSHDEQEIKVKAGKGISSFQKCFAGCVASNESVSIKIVVFSAK